MMDGIGAVRCCRGEMLLRPRATAVCYGDLFRPRNENSGGIVLGGKKDTYGTMLLG